MQRLTPSSVYTGRMLTVFALIFVALPILSAVWFGMSAGGGSTWDHILHNRLLPYTLTTLIVLVLVGGLILAIALPCAWLVSMYSFPGRRVFEWALILPLAMPGYVMSYAWADLFGVAGPVQSALRSSTGMMARDYWFPDLFTVPGLSFILASTLFPYVYIIARAAFTTSSLATLEAARSLGVSGVGLFRRVGFPAARPAIVAGLALALMEAAADYGAANFLGIQTLGVGIVRAWSSFGEPATAARLALVLISIAFLFVILARVSKGHATTRQTSTRWLTPTRIALSGASRWAAFSLCATVLLVAFFIPLGRLLWLSLEVGTGSAPMLPPLIASLVLGLAGTVLALICALSFTLSTWLTRRVEWLPRLITTAGYAAPGVVLGLGALLLLKATGMGLSGAGAFVLLICIYASRFTAAGAEPMRAALMRAPQTLDYATRSLGGRGVRRLLQIDLPVLMPGALAGGLILFVEMIKELPATMMLRPLGMETLAVRANFYATDERLALATLPSLLITLAGLGPVLLLSWQLSKSGRVSA